MTYEQALIVSPDLNQRGTEFLRVDEATARDIITSLTKQLSCLKSKKSKMPPLQFFLKGRQGDCFKSYAETATTKHKRAFFHVVVHSVVGGKLGAIRHM